MSHTVTVIAPAKVNLYLGVGPRRSDGYHDVTTVMHALDFGDELLIETAERFDLITDVDLDVSVERNLVTRAVRALGTAVGREPDIRVTLCKRVPTGAGLGGGSSDAAAALVGAAHVLGIDREAVDLGRLGAQLGADVPFFLTGGAALMSGRGDVLERALPSLDAAVALLKPPASVPTARAYAAFDAQPAPVSDLEPVLDALENGDVPAVGAALGNNLEKAAASLVPEVAEAVALAEQAGGVLGAQVCGSGSAVFALCVDDDAAARVAAAGIDRGWWAIATRTARSGVRAIGRAS